MAVAGSAAASRLIGSGVQGLWIHVDVDVLDDALMPAVDSRQDDGLTYTELSALLRPVFATDRVVGMQVTIYDPERDEGGVAGSRLVDWLVSLLAR
jgi:arginase